MNVWRLGRAFDVSVVMPMLPALEPTHSVEAHRLACVTALCASCGAPIDATGNLVDSACEQCQTERAQAIAACLASHADENETRPDGLIGPIVSPEPLPIEP